MSFPRAARAARASQSGLRRMFAVMAMVAILVLAGLSLSCGNSRSSSSGPSHLAYATLPSLGSVLLLRINDATGAVAAGGTTPSVNNTSPNGLALLPSKQFLYAANSRANTISIFSVAPDGSLTLTGTPTPAGNSPDEAVIDPTGQYLLVTNNYGNGLTKGDISVYSIDAGSGALTEAPNSPFAADANPTAIVFTHSGQFVYVTNPGEGKVTGFVFCPPQRAAQPQCSAATGVLTPVPLTPTPSGLGAAALVVDASDQYLYVANPSANNPYPYLSTNGNISAFQINSGTGALTELTGSPFTATNGSGPSAIAIDPSGRFLYAVTPGSSNSIWCFAITPTNGQLVAVTGSPFSLAAGGQFALFDPIGGFFYIGSNSTKGLEGYTYNPSTGAPKVISGSPFSIVAIPGEMVLSD